jgi:hypothetical protein
VDSIKLQILLLSQFPVLEPGLTVSCQHHDANSINE